MAFLGRKRSLAAYDRNGWKAVIAVANPCYGDRTGFVLAPPALGDAVHYEHPPNREILRAPACKHGVAYRMRGANVLPQRNAYGSGD